MTASSASAPATVDCPHCLSPVRRRAKVCAACGRWTVRTRLIGAAEFLRVIGYLWMVLSLIGALVFGLGDGPLSGVAVGVALALQGLLLGLVAVVIAENSPRMPD